MATDIDRDRLVGAYLSAKTRVRSAGFSHEIEWQSSRRLSDVDEQTFLREAAWVVLSAGMRETVVRDKFPRISEAFLEWRSGREIVAAVPACRQHALAVFRHEGKIDAILEIASRVARAGFIETRRCIANQGVGYLRTFPYIGPVTAFHLAKNLGLDIVKPDRHLVRIAGASGFASPDALCREIAAVIDEKLNVIDIVLWRFATLHRNYLDYFRAAPSQTAPGCCRRSLTRQPLPTFA